MELTPAEIENVSTLLLDIDERNQEIALVWIQNNPTVISAVHQVVDAALAANEVPKENPFFVFKRLINNNYNVYIDKNITNKMMLIGRDYGDFLFSNPTYEKYYYTIAQKITNNNTAKAVVGFQALVEYFPLNSTYHLKLATALSLKHHYSKKKEKIINSYLRSYQLDPTAAALYGLAFFYEKSLKELPLAEQYYKKAIDEFPTALKSYCCYADLLLQRKNYPEAEQIVEAAKEQLNEHIPTLLKGEIYYLLGVIAWQYLGDIDLAAAHFDEAGLHMDVAKIYQARIKMYEEQNDKEQVEYWSDLFYKWGFF